MIPNLQLVSPDRPQPMSLRSRATSIIARWAAPRIPGTIRYGIDTYPMFIALTDEELLHVLQNTLDEVKRRNP